MSIQQLATGGGCLLQLMSVVRIVGAFELAVSILTEKGEWVDGLWKRRSA